jgi:UDP-N-acetyl-D-mannosaminuronate dehydrogenase
LAERVAIIGLGEVGRPLYEIVKKAGLDVTGIDVELVKLPAPGTVSVLHICIPFEIDDFVGVTVRYYDLLRPRLLVINSSVAVGTTRTVHQRTGGPIAHSPVRGKHTRMLSELTHYDKFVGPIDAESGTAATRHFESLGMRTRILSSPEATELAKLTETTYFGLLIAWAQEVERYCDILGVDYDEVVALYEEVGYLPPVKFFPGVIGGHCVMPNIEILKEVDDTALLEAIRKSNEDKFGREALISRRSATGG